MFITFFGINSVLIIIESLFFTTTPLIGHIHNLVSGALSWAGMSILLTILFRPHYTDMSFGTILREALAQRSLVSNLWRFGLAGFLYLPIFMIFGILIQPFVSTFYEDPSYGISQLFSIPAAETIFLLERCPRVFVGNSGLSLDCNSWEANEFVGDKLFGFHLSLLH